MKQLKTIIKRNKSPKENISTSPQKKIQLLSKNINNYINEVEEENNNDNIFENLNKLKLYQDFDYKQDQSVMQHHLLGDKTAMLGIKYQNQNLEQMQKAQEILNYLNSKIGQQEPLKNKIQFLKKQAKDGKADATKLQLINIYDEIIDNQKKQSKNVNNLINDKAQRINDKFQQNVDQWDKLNDKFKQKSQRPSSQYGVLEQNHQYKKKQYLQQRFHELQDDNEIYGENLWYHQLRSEIKKETSTSRPNSAFSFRFGSKVNRRKEQVVTIFPGENLENSKIKQFFVSTFNKDENQMKINQDFVKYAQQKYSSRKSKTPRVNIDKQQANQLQIKGQNIVHKLRQNLINDKNQLNQLYEVQFDSTQQEELIISN